MKNSQQRRTRIDRQGTLLQKEELQDISKMIITSYKDHISTMVHVKSVLTSQTGSLTDIDDAESLMNPFKSPHYKYVNINKTVSRNNY